MEGRRGNPQNREKRGDCFAPCGRAKTLTDFLHGLDASDSDCSASKHSKTLRSP